MGTFQELKSVVRENDFVEVRRSKDGTTAWFSKTGANMRLCIDGHKQCNRLLGDRPRQTQFKNIPHCSFIERLVCPTEGASAPNNGTTHISCDAVVTT